MGGGACKEFFVDGAGRVGAGLSLRSLLPLVSLARECVLSTLLCSADPFACVPGAEGAQHPVDVALMGPSVGSSPSWVGPMGTQEVGGGA